MIIYRSSCQEADLDIIRTNDQFLFYCNECGRICEPIKIEIAIIDEHSLDLPRKRNGEKKYQI